LTFTVTVIAAETVTIEWLYDQNLFPADYIHQVAEDFVSLFRSALNSSDTVVASLPLASTASESFVSRHWNRSRMPFPFSRIEALIEQQMLRTPTAIAVEFGTERVTYEQLNARASRFAQKLMASGVKPEQGVGLCLARTCDVVVAILGAWKAGAFVVPIDPEYPADRISFMLTDTAVRLAIVDNLEAARVKLIRKIDPAISIVSLADEGPAQPAIEWNSDLALSPRHIAYCIYTSGSTGLPKGVCVEHLTLSNLIEWHRTVWLADPGTRVLLFSPISFDVSFHEITAGL
jgi:non-ribosomal peptide synthetase component F